VAQQQDLRLRGPQFSQHGSHLLALLTAQNVLKRAVGNLLVDSARLLLVASTPAGRSKRVDAGARRGAI